MDTKTHTDFENDGAPKRRVIRRVVRRIPKQKPVEAAPQVSEEAFESMNSNEAIPTISSKMPSETIMTGRDEVLTPTPMVSREQAAPAQNPKAMILEQLIAHRPRVESVPAALSTRVDESTTAASMLDAGVTPSIISGSAILAEPEAPIAATQQTSTKNMSASIPGTSPEGRSSIESVWPYLAAAKQGTAGEVPETSRADLEDDERGRYFSWLPWFVGALLLIGAAFFGISYFSGADVIITPKSEAHTIDADIVSEKDGDPTKVLPVAVITLEETAEIDVPASQTPSARQAAFGKLTVYNSQSVPQLLITGTRFANPANKIYKIRSAITVPAAKGGTPGSFVANVYAESPGASYNITEKQRFDLPALRKGDKATKIWAENAQPITGGTDGVSNTVAEDQKDSAIGELQMQVQKKLRDNATHELLASQISYDSLYVFSYDSPVYSPAQKPGHIHMTLKGRLAAPVFDRTILSAALAKVALGDAYKSENIKIEGIERLNATITDKDKSVDLMKVKDLTLHFSGDTIFRWSVDVDGFRRALLNVDRNSFQTSVIRNFPAIKNAEATLRPFWKQYFPSNVDQIQVKIVQ